MTMFRIFLSLVAPSLVVTPLIIGCGPGSHERYIPASDQARSAVDAALSSWKAGEPHQTVKSHTPPVDLFDARRQDGKKVESFHIVDEVRGQDRPTFKVNLQFASETEDEETAYVVVGSDPLLVFRVEDFTKASGM